jgi:hypothetical protein
MKDLNKLNNEFTAFKEDILYEYLSTITEKIETMLTQSYQEMHNNYILKEAHISPYHTTCGLYGMQIYFIFNLSNRKDLEYTVSFNTTDTELCQEIRVYDKEKINDNMQKHLEYFHENLFLFNHKDIIQMIARRVHESKNPYYYDVALPQSWKNVTKSILGEKYYVRYEKEKLEQNLHSENNKQIKKLKV